MILSLFEILPSHNHIYWFSPQHSQQSQPSQEDKSGLVLSSDSWEPNSLAVRGHSALCAVPSISHNTLHINIVTIVER